MLEYNVYIQLYIKKIMCLKSILWIQLQFTANLYPLIIYIHHNF